MYKVNLFYLGSVSRVDVKREEPGGKRIIKGEREKGKKKRLKGQNRGVEGKKKINGKH